MQRWLPYLASRGRLLLAAGLSGVLGAFCMGPPHEPGAEGLTAALSAESGAEVSEFAWEPPSTALKELLFGRGILFVSKKPGEKFAEVQRAFVRLSFEGRVLSVGRLRNLSQTDLADEGGLRAHGRHALYVSESDAGAALLTVLDLGGERRQAGGWVERLELSLSRFLEQGTTAGLGQCDVLLPTGVRELVVSERGGTLVLRLAERQIELELDDLFNPSSTRAHELDVMRRVGRAPPLGHWAADVGRLLVGPGPIARLEEWALSIRDRFARTGYTLTHLGAARPSPKAPLPAPAAPHLPTSTAWPPADLISPWPKREQGEGHWLSFAGDLMPKAPKPAPSPLFRTFVRPDPERPYARAHLVVIDTTRLELGLRGGYEDPRPRTGPPGSGHVPDDPRVFRRIVATFNGAFKTTHGSYGMKAEGRVLVPPTPGAATLRIDPDGDVGMGAYEPARASTVPGDGLEFAQAYRQNLDLLLEDDRLLPTGRLDWGDHLIGGSVVAERSGVCVRGDGHLVYAWSEEATARSLARAMQMAGCVRGMHLDMNPGHCTFAAHRIRSFQPLAADGRLLSPAMKASATRYLRWSPKDFFYLAYRDAFPRSPAADAFAFRAAPGQQPEPADLPALVLGERTIAGIALEIERVDLGRIQLGLAIGSEEAPGATATPPVGPALAAWNLGHATHGNRPGLSQGTLAVVAMDRAFATFVLSRTEGAYVKLPGEPLEPAEQHDLVQLELLARDGALLDHGRRITTRREHGALCIDEAGYLWLGRMTHDTPGPLAQALIDLGCQHVLEADRGSQSPASVERAGVDAGVRAARPESALVASARPLRGRAYAF